MYRKTMDGSAYVVDGPVDSNPPRDGYIRVEISPSQQLDYAIERAEKAEAERDEWKRVAYASREAYGEHLVTSHCIPLSERKQ
jgi:hypothetical protein